MGPLIMNHLVYCWW